MVELKNTIDKSSPLPIYYQIREIIKGLIETGDLKSGDKVPTEEEFCKAFSVSRMTVRQALEDLVSSGILIRQKGKGTFISSNRFDFELSVLHSFSEDMKSRGFIVKSKVLESRIISPDVQIAEKLSLSAKSKIFRVKRLRLVEKEPLAIEYNHIPLDQFPGIAEDDLEKTSLFDLFENKYKILLRYSEQTIEPVNAKKKESELLQIKKGSPLLKIAGITYTAHNIPVDYILGLYRGDRYKFRLILKR